MNKKTALITGSSRGIGRAIAILFARNNYNVVINYNKSEKEAQELYDMLSKENLHWNQKCNQNTLPLFQVLFSDHRPAIGDRCHCGYQHQINAFITESCCAQTYKDQSCNLFL